MIIIITIRAIRSISLCTNYPDPIAAIIGLIDLIAAIVQFAYHIVFSTVSIVQPLTLMNHTNTIRYSSVYCCNIVYNRIWQATIA